MDKVSIIINEKNANQTIKEYLKTCHIGRGRVEAIRVNKQSFINGEYKNLETILNVNDELSFAIEEEIDFIAEPSNLSVAYEDEYLLIVNKPCNMIVHPATKDGRNTLANQVAYYYKKNDIHRNVRYLHRIDKETTGLVLFAKDFISEGVLLKDIEVHDVKRSYLAFVEGTLTQKKGTIRQNIAEDRHVNGKMMVAKYGKEAITNYEVMKEYSGYSLVKFNLQTGRTHQIRVHAAYIGHPLLGDPLYGGNKRLVNRVALHSYEMSFIHPITKKNVTIKCDIPNDLSKLFN